MDGKPLLSEDTFKKYLKAGQIAAEARKKISKRVEEGSLILQICEEAENTIRTLGGEPAFPCNVCVNDVAAHYSSPPNDTSKLPNKAVVKIDLGVHVDGYIADTAFTIHLDSQYDAMIYTVNEALKHAVRTIHPKVKITTIGKIIQQTIEKYGFKPIRNLSGHQMLRYVLHTGKSIPNISSLGFQTIKEGEVYAIEPFLTEMSGQGSVRNGKNAYIYRFQKDRKINHPKATELLSTIKSKFKSLPFSLRWIDNHEEQSTLQAFKELIKKRCISTYPVLIESDGGIVAQAEHTVLVTKNGCIITTQ
jgi:methionyl aminopeptidase